MFDSMGSKKGTLMIGNNSTTTTKNELLSKNKK
jgi:hypothetical protein